MEAQAPTPGAPSAAATATAAMVKDAANDISKNDKKGIEGMKIDARPHVTWDEETIAEHDQLRGTRMKIEEPNTPYHYYGSDQEEEDGADDQEMGEKEPVSPARSLSGRENVGLQWSELQTKLEDVQDKQLHGGTDDDEFSARDAEGKKIKKDPKFTAKRKSHYNEFEMMKAWKQSHKYDTDENDEDDQEGKEGKEGSNAATASREAASSAPLST